MEIPDKGMYNGDTHNLRYIFPYLKNKYLYHYLKIDDKSIYYISHKNISSKIRVL